MYIHQGNLYFFLYVLDILVLPPIEKYKFYIWLFIVKLQNDYI